MPKIIVVDMDDIGFTSEINTNLVTYGISTCIAFIIYASFYDEDDELINVRGLYHWSGFALAVENQEQHAQDEFIYFSDQLRAIFHLPKELDIQINSLSFIGGEKAEWEEDELILSGTEAEVTCLIKAVQEFNFKNYHFNIVPEHISHHHFLTSGNELINIKLMSDTCECKIEQNSCLGDELICSSPSKFC